MGKYALLSHSMKYTLRLVKSKAAEGAFSIVSIGTYKTSSRRVCSGLFLDKKLSTSKESKKGLLIGGRFAKRTTPDNYLR
jgi:hypothetical protein